MSRFIPTALVALSILATALVAVAPWGWGKNPRDEASGMPCSERGILAACPQAGLAGFELIAPGPGLGGARPRERRCFSRSTSGNSVWKPAQ